MQKLPQSLVQVSLLNYPPYRKLRVTSDYSADMNQSNTLFLTLVTIWLLFGKSESKHLAGHQKIPHNLPLLRSFVIEDQLFEEDEDIPHSNKRQNFDDYGHMRFGKRDQFEDYGHLRFGRNRQ